MTGARATALLAAAVAAVALLPAAAPASILPESRLIDGGSGAFCQVSQEADVRCWGMNYTRFWDGTPMQSVKRITGLADEPVTDIDVQSTPCVVQAGRIRCWGYRWGTSTFLGSSRTDAAEFSGFRDVTDVTTGFAMACALRANGTVWCWGRNDKGQVGDGSWDYEALDPVQVPGLDDAVAIDAGSAHVCAVRRGGTVWCWGSNVNAQLGHGTTDFSRHGLPEQVGTDAQRITDAVAIDAGAQSTCVIRRTGAVACWGAGSMVQLLQPNPVLSGRPIYDVPLIDDAVEIASDNPTCVLRSSSSRPWCWGNNHMGQLGDGTTTERRYTPAPVPGVTDATAITVDTYSVCALVLTHTRCWGANSNGALLQEADENPHPDPVTIGGSQDWAVDGVLRASGPLTALSMGRDLRCSRTVNYQQQPLFAGGRRGCATYVQVADTLYGPKQSAMGAGWPTGVTPYRARDQFEYGRGTAADPLELETTATAGAVEVRQLDRYVNGDDRTSSEITLENTSGRSVRTRVTVAGDCVHDDADGGPGFSRGFGHQGAADRVSGAVSCTQTLQGGRFIALVPRSPGAQGTVDSLSAVAGAIERGADFAECRCGRELQHAAAITWEVTLAAGERRVLSFETAFSEQVDVTDGGSGATLDIDGDAIPDDWEESPVPVDANGDGRAELDLHAMGAGDDMRDLFVQIAPMRVPCEHFEGTCRGGYVTLTPRANAIARVQRQFLARGIRLHVDGGPLFVMNPQSGARWGGRSRIGPAGSYDSREAPLGALFADDLARLAARSFPAADRRPVFRNAVLTGPLSRGDTGIGQPGGRWMAFSNYGGCALGPPCKFSSQGLRYEAVVFMHELGHTLGLLHGGNEDTNFKPNYPSLMNYAYSFPGVPFNAGGEKRYVEASLTYSSGELDPIDERALTESGPLTPSEYAGRFMINWLCGTQAHVFEPGDAEHDWDCDGAISTGPVAADVNGDGALGTLRDHNDWDALQFWIDPNAAYGTAQNDGPINAPPVVRITGDDLLVLRPGERAEATVEIRNPHPEQRTYKLAATAEGAEVSGVPESVTVPADGSKTLRLQITAQSAAAGVELMAIRDDFDLLDETAFAIRVVGPEEQAPDGGAGGVSGSASGGDSGAGGQSAGPGAGGDAPAGAPSGASGTPKQCAAPARAAAVRSARRSSRRVTLRLRRAPVTARGKFRRARTVAVTLERDCKLVARGTLRGKVVTLRPTARGTRLRGAYALRWRGGGVRVTVR